MELLALLVAVSVVLLAALAATALFPSARHLRERRRIQIETARTVARLHELRHDAEAEMLRVIMTALLRRQDPS